MRIPPSRVLFPLFGAFFAAACMAPSTASASTLLTTCAEIQAIPPSAAGTYRLANDIDCVGVVFAPIVNFSGTFEGDGYEVSNVSISSVSSNIGFFDELGAGAVVENLTLTDINVVTTGAYVGLLAGTSSGGAITNVSVSGTIADASAYVGGLVGIASDTVITRAHASVVMTVPGTAYVGGLIGIASGTFTITRSSSDGSIVAGNYVGGLIGISNEDGTVSHSYSTASVNGGTYVGGLIGVSDSPNSYTYAAGAVVASGLYGGGLIGTDGPFADTTDSYWDTDTSLQVSSAAGTGKTTIQMQDVSTFAGWNFSTIWHEPSVGVYPRLRAYDDTPPTAPGTPTASNPTRYPPSVSWTAATDAGVGLAAIPYTIQWSNTADFSGTVYTSTTVSNAFFDATTLADGAWYYRVSAKDVLRNTTAYVNSAPIIVDAAQPVITLIGSSSVSVNQDEAYVDAGATALDAVQGDLTSILGVTNLVDTRVPGTYTVTYAVTDAAGNVGEPRVRTVRVVAVNRGGGAVTASFVQPTAIRGVSGDESTTFVMTINGSTLPILQTSSRMINLGLNADPQTVSGYAASLRADFEGASIYPYQPSIQYQLPEGSGTHTVYVKLYSTTGHASPTLMRTVEYSPSGQRAERVQEAAVSAAPSVTVPSANVYQFTRNLRVRMQGNDVRELQKFLNARGFLVARSGIGSPGKESMYFGPATVRALIRFQEAHRQQLLAPLSLRAGTGLFLEATRAFVNARAL